MLRERVPGRTQQEFADQLGLTRGSVANWECGKRITRGNIAIICQMEGARQEWLKDGTGAMMVERGKNKSEQGIEIGGMIAPSSESSAVVMSETLPIYATKDAGEGFMLLTQDILDRVSRPSILRWIDGAYGVLVPEDSMSPAYRAGDTAWINPVIAPLRGEDVLVCRPNPNSGEVGLIAMLIDYDDEHWTVETINPTRKQHKLRRQDWPKCQRVVAKYAR